MMMTDTQAYEIAQLIVDDLFRNGRGETARRLELSTGTVHGKRRYLGGWNRLAAIDRIAAILKAQEARQS